MPGDGVLLWLLRLVAVGQWVWLVYRAATTFARGQLLTALLGGGLLVVLWMVVSLGTSAGLFYAAPETRRVLSLVAIIGVGLSINSLIDYYQGRMGN